MQAGASTAVRGADLLEQADERHEVDRRLEGEGMTLTVVEVGRVDDDRFVLHVTAAADGLSAEESLELTVPSNVLARSPWEMSAGLSMGQVDTRGLLDADFGWGPGRHPVRSWIVVPSGTRSIPVDFLVGVPAIPGRTVSPEAPDREPIPAPAPESAEGEGTPDLFLPPTSPGTERYLGRLTIDMAELGVPERLWR
jgi:hypothetical protein